jgi:plasmid stability protein
MNTRTVNLRNLPEDLVRKAKAVAAWRGISLKDFIIQAVRQSLATHEAANAVLFAMKGDRRKAKAKR